MVRKQGLSCARMSAAAAAAAASADREVAGAAFDWNRKLQGFRLVYLAADYRNLNTFCSIYRYTI